MVKFSNKPYRYSTPKGQEDSPAKEDTSLNQCSYRDMRRLHRNDPKNSLGLMHLTSIAFSYLWERGKK